MRSIIRDAPGAVHDAHPGQRLIPYQFDTATKVAGVLPALMTEHKFGLVRIPDLIAYLRDESGYGSWSDEDERVDRNEVRW